MKRSRINQCSAKNAAAEAEFRRNREIRRQMAGDRCECHGLAPDCTGWGSMAHHVVKRRDGGHAVENLRWLGALCHLWLHAHPTEAAAAGLIASPTKAAKSVILTDLPDDHIEATGAA